MTKVNVKALVFAVLFCALPANGATATATSTGHGTSTLAPNDAMDQALRSAKLNLSCHGGTMGAVEVTAATMVLTPATAGSFAEYYAFVAVKAECTQ